MTGEISIYPKASSSSKTSYTNPRYNRIVLWIYGISIPNFTPSFKRNILRDQYLVKRLIKSYVRIWYYNIKRKFLPTSNQHRNIKIIIEELLRLNPSNKQLIKINVCRLYLKVSHLSNIVNPNGKNVKSDFIIGKRGSYSDRIYSWSYQLNPTSKVWILWRETLHSIFNIYSNILPIKYHVKNGYNILISSK